MASAFTAGQPAGARKEPSKVIAYELKAEDHAFTKLGPDGVTKVPTGEEKPVAKLRGRHADGSVDKLAAWIWLDTPDALDAFIASMPDLYRAALALREVGEKHMGWPARAKAPEAPKPAAAPTKKASAFTASQAAVEKAAAEISGGKDPYADLPF